DNDVRHIMEDDFGCLWLGTRRGIVCIDKKELSDFAKGRIEKINSILYDESDGIKSPWCENGTKTRDGRLWFTTDKGVVVIDPSEI
ncbi:MAG: hypothetical protein GTN68_22485, partial [Candidatus Aminicenantes bacterium]|nr:hypothetical protein [Candidatus Aminicenantes bacterium]NIQ69253.1 hypothetical protein [Candidatus Aminicenantes bacterium]